MKSTNNTLDFTGDTIQGLVPNNIAVTTVTTTYTALVTDKTIKTTTNSFTITLYTAVGNSGAKLTINNQGSGTTITVDGAGTETINSELTQTLFYEDSMDIESDGANWIIK